MQSTKSILMCYSSTKQPMTSITSLPEDIIIDCLSRIPRQYYPTISLVSKFFRSLITSPELYSRRALLDRTECCLYVTICDGRRNRWYTLRRRPDGNYLLVPITSLPCTRPVSSYVAVDSKIYVIEGGDRKTSSSDVSLIDCRFHTTHHLPNMPRAVTNSISSLVDGKIYVIGGPKYGFLHCPFSPNYGAMDLMVFDIKSNTWESKMRPDMAACKCGFFNCTSVVTMLNKIYFNCVVYDTKEDRWDKDDIINFKWSSGNGQRVLDGVLYYYSVSRQRLEGYDFKERCWKVVKGVPSLGCTYIFPSPLTVIFDENVMVFYGMKFDDKTEIWCVEIKVERDEKGDICGSVEWCGCVLDGQCLNLNDCNLNDILVVKV